MALRATALLVALALGACGTGGSLGGTGGSLGGTAGSLGGTADAPANNSTGLFSGSPDPLSRPTQVAWTAARATHCGFVLDQAQFRARYLASERAAGQSPQKMRKIEEAYDYTFQAISAEARKDAGYCTRDRVDKVRADLNRYLAGDFRAKAQ